MGKYFAHYNMCQECQFLFVVNADWLSESYSRPISILDTGILERNLQISNDLEHLLPDVAPNGNFVDWAGGIGILTRLMRDKGFNFFWQDEFANNEVAIGFEWSSRQRVEVVTAIEVMEHVEDPIRFIENVFEQTGANIFIFTQQLHNGNPDPSWWYFAPETGQHISFFSIKTLQTIANKLKLHLSTFGNVFLLSDKYVRISFSTQLKYKISLVLQKFLRSFGKSESLTLRDKVYLTNVDSNL